MCHPVCCSPHPLCHSCRPSLYSRFCAGAAGCTSKLHSPTDSLRLVFALDDASLLSKAAFRWASTDVPLSAAASTTKQVRGVVGHQSGRCSWSQLARFVHHYCLRLSHLLQSLVLPPFTAAGAAVFTDGATVVINVTATGRLQLGGASG